MNQFLDIFKRLYVVAVITAAVAIVPLALHAVARVLWFAAKIGENLNPQQRVGALHTGTRMICQRIQDTLESCRTVSIPEAQINSYKESVRTFWNYNTDANGMIATHALAILVLAALFGTVSLVSWLLLRYNVVTFAVKQIATSVAVILSKQREIENFYPDCTNEFCTCRRHWDEKFSMKKQIWKLVPRRELAGRYEAARQSMR